MISVLSNERTPMPALPESEKEPPTPALPQKGREVKCKMYNGK